MDEGFVEKIQKESITEEKEFTEEFYKKYHETRLMLIRTFKENDNVSNTEAIYFTQLFLNRLIFMFFVSDKGFIPDRQLFTNRILHILQSNSCNEHSRKIYDDIKELFIAFDKGSKVLGIFGFNGGMFSGVLPDKISFLDFKDDEYFKDILLHSKFTQAQLNSKANDIVSKYSQLNPIITNLLILDSFDFNSEVNVNILGHIFEQSISDLEELKKDETSKRKKDGIYYTPEYITDYICRNTIIPYLSKSNISTVSELLDEYDDNLTELEEKLRKTTILDPSCGSGAFLVKAVDVLLEISKEIKNKKEDGNYSSDQSLITESWDEDKETREIIEQNIYGVDINRESVEITRLSLFLKLVSNDRKLSYLDQYVKVGNSLIEDKSIDPNAFSWRDEFPEILGDLIEYKGFDVIIGNPPYVRQESLENKEQMQLSKDSDLKKYVIPSKMDLSGYFYYHSLNRLKNKGKLGFITSDSWMSFGYGKSLQNLFLDKCCIEVLMRTKFNVFDDVDIKTVTAILEKSIGSDNTVHLIYAKKKEELLNAEVIPVKKRQQEFKVGNWIYYFSENKFIPKIEMVKMSDVGIIKRGKTTGCNDFFVLTKDIIEKYEIAEEYMQPVMSRDLHFGVLDNDDANEFLLNVNESKRILLKSKNGKKILKYIEHGENTKVIPKKGKGGISCMISELSTIKNHNPWYSLKLKNPSEIFLARFAAKQMKMFENNGNFYARDNFACFTPNNKKHTHALLSYFSSSYFSLYLEKNGHLAGGGALQFLMTDYKNASVPNFDKLSKKDLEKVSKAWLNYRDDFNKEKLDNIVSEILGFIECEQIKIREELEILIKQRTESKKSK